MFSCSEYWIVAFEYSNALRLIRFTEPPRESAGLSGDGTFVTSMRDAAVLTVKKSTARLALASEAVATRAPSTATVVKIVPK